MLFSIEHILQVEQTGKKILKFLNLNDIIRDLVHVCECVLVHVCVREVSIGSNQSFSS